jgi:hypothetical protein
MENLHAYWDTEVYISFPTLGGGSSDNFHISLFIFVFLFQLLFFSKVR